MSNLVEVIDYGSAGRKLVKINQPGGQYGMKYVELTPGEAMQIVRELSELGMPILSMPKLTPDLHKKKSIFSKLKKKS